MYKLRIYFTSGDCAGYLDHEEFFETKEELDARYKELFKYELLGSNPTAWKRIGNNWKKMGGY